MKNISRTPVSVGNWFRRYNYTAVLKSLEQFRISKRKMTCSSKYITYILFVIFHLYLHTYVYFIYHIDILKYRNYNQLYLEIKHAIIISQRNVSEDLFITARMCFKILVVIGQ